MTSTLCPQASNVLVEGKCWVNIMEYTPKPAQDTRIETHNDFIDLQYTFDGDEVYGVARTLIPVTEYDPEKTGLSSGPRTRLITCPPNLTTSFFISPGRITSHQ